MKMKAIPLADIIMKKLAIIALLGGAEAIFIGKHHRHRHHDELEKKKAELRALERDYAGLKHDYQSLVEEKDYADLAYVQPLPKKEKRSANSFAQQTASSTEQQQITDRPIGELMMQLSKRHHDKMKQ